MVDAFRLRIKKARRATGRALTWLTRPIRRLSQRSRADLHDYWRNSIQSPTSYAEADPKRSTMLVELLREYVGEGPILEIGPNAGRNLHYLREAGYEALTGIEISPVAVEEMRSRYPELADANVLVGPVEEHIRSFGDGEFACVFSMAVLEHIHRDSEWVFGEMARIARTVVTIEDEDTVSERHFPRDYRRVFESTGLRQVFEMTLDANKHGLGSAFKARVFKHPGDEGSGTN